MHSSANPGLRETGMQEAAGPGSPRPLLLSIDRHVMSPQCCLWWQPTTRAGGGPWLLPEAGAGKEASSSMSPVYSFHDFSFGISICLVLVKEMHPYLITGSPFCDLYFKAFFSLYFPLPFFFSWQKYRPNMMCILLKVQHNLLPLVCLQNKHSKLHDMAFQPSLLLFLCGFFFFFHLPWG